MLSLKEFVNRFSFNKKKVHIDFETCDPNPFNLGTVRLAFPHLYEKKKVEGKMGIDFTAMQQREKDHLTAIIERDEPTSIKIERIILWQREKRCSELHNLVTHHHSMSALATTVATRADSAVRGVELQREWIDKKLFQLNLKKMKGDTMKTTVTLNVSGPQGCGKTTFIRTVLPLIEMAAKMTFRFTDGKIQINTNETNIDGAFAKPSVDEAEMRAALAGMEKAEAERYAACKRMNQLLRELGVCPKEIAEMEAENEAENHNVASLVERTRKEFL